MARMARPARASQTRSRRIPLPPSGSGRRRKQIRSTLLTGWCVFCSVNDTNFFYSTSRFNPLFEEEAVIETNISKDVIDDQETISTTSSGYGSNTTHKGKLIYFFFTKKNWIFYYKRIYGNKIVSDYDLESGYFKLNP